MRPKRYGCCGTGPAAAFAQLDPSVETALLPPLESAGLPSLGQLFTVSVGAGLTVWFLTRLLSKHGK